MQRGGNSRPEGPSWGAGRGRRLERGCRLEQGGRAGYTRVPRGASGRHPTVISGPCGLHGDPDGELEAILGDWMHGVDACCATRPPDHALIVVHHGQRCMLMHAHACSCMHSSGDGRVGPGRGTGRQGEGGCTAVGEAPPGAMHGRVRCDSVCLSIVSCCHGCFVRCGFAPGIAAV